MPPAVAQEALRQATTTEFLGLLAYIEGFGLVVGTLGVEVVPPRELCLAVDDVLYGRETWDPRRGTLGEHLRVVARAYLERLVYLRALVRLAPTGVPTFETARLAAARLDDAHLGTTQVGTLRPIVELANDAGERMVVRRNDDVKVLAAAVIACNATRAKLHLISHQAAGNTAPFRLPRVLLASDRVPPVVDDHDALRESSEAPVDAVGTADSAVPR